MPYKDPQKQREYQRKYQREYQRMKRAGNNTGVKVLTRDLTHEELQTSAGMLKLLSETLENVKTARGDILQKARVIGYLISIGLKAVETVDLEKRLTEIEDQFKEGVTSVKHEKPYFKNRSGA